MKVTIENADKFTVKLTSGQVIILSWEEWMELRRIQNSLIHTEPK